MSYLLYREKKPATIHENQITDLSEEESYSECEMVSDGDVDNFIISLDSVSDQRVFVSIEN